MCITYLSLMFFSAISICIFILHEFLLFTGIVGEKICVTQYLVRFKCQVIFKKLQFQLYFFIQAL